MGKRGCADRPWPREQRRSSEGKEAEMAERSPAIEKFVRQMVEAFERGDIAFFERTTSHEPGTLDIATDPDEWAEGYDAFVQLERDMMQGQPSIDSLRLEEVAAFAEGSVGWGAGRGYLEIQGMRIPFRTTVVVHQEDGEWKAVQSHASIGVPNAEMLNPLFQAKPASLP